ncbi:MAG: XdhC family protein [bacterium]
MNQLNLQQVLRTAIREERPVALAVVVRNETDNGVPLAKKMLIFPGGRTEGSLGDKVLTKSVIRDAHDLLAKQRSTTRTYEFESGKKIEVYIESIVPPPPFVIIGADPDAVPIVSLAKQMGFKVLLVDHREAFANPEKYPQADLTIVVCPETLANTVRINDRTFVLVKTHNYLRDKEILKTVLKSPAVYVGQLGPKARMEDLLRDLAKEGVTFSQKELDKLYGPVGLDIGAESPEQIAISILSEMLAVKNGRLGGLLREQTDAIHPRSET